MFSIRGLTRVRTEARQKLYSFFILLYHILSVGENLVSVIWLIRRKLYLLTVLETYNYVLIV